MKRITNPLSEMGAEIKTQNGKLPLHIKGKVLNNCNHIYISFDVDSLDSEKVSSGTGTPIKNGLLIDECKAMLQQLLNWNKTKCLEITEINPLLDKKNKMTKSVFDILEYILKI